MDAGELRPRQLHKLWVACTCQPGKLMHTDSLPRHVLQKHCDKFVERCGQAEVEVARRALCTAREMVAEVQQHTRSEMWRVWWPRRPMPLGMRVE